MPNLSLIHNHCIKDQGALKACPLSASARSEGSSLFPTLLTLIHICKYIYIYMYANIGMPSSCGPLKYCLADCETL